MSLALIMSVMCLTSTFFDWWHSQATFSWRFRCLIPFEVNESAHCTSTLLSLYILVQDYASGIKILLARCFSDWLLFSNLSRCWVPWKFWGLQAWVPRVNHSHLWGYFWFQIFLWDIQKYNEVTDFIKKLHVCDMDVISQEDLITYEFLVQEATQEYRDFMDSKRLEPAITKEKSQDQPSLPKA